MWECHVLYCYKYLLVYWHIYWITFAYIGLYSHVMDHNRILGVCVKFCHIHVFHVYWWCLLRLRESVILYGIVCVRTTTDTDHDFGCKNGMPPFGIVGVRGIQNYIVGVRGYTVFRCRCPGYTVLHCRRRETVRFLGI